LRPDFAITPSKQRKNQSWRLSTRSVARASVLASVRASDRVDVQPAIIATPPPATVTVVPIVKTPVGNMLEIISIALDAVTAIVFLFIEFSCSEGTS
jgi:hypothetical protein